MKRVVVTGMGAVSACGLGADALIAATQAGISGVKPVQFDDLPQQRVSTAARLTLEDVAAIVGPTPHKMRDPVAEYALFAAREAVAQAGLTPEHFGEVCGVSIGSGQGGAKTLNSNYMKFGREGPMRLDPMTVPKIMNNAAAGWVSMEFGAMGPAFCLATACSAGSQSIGLGMQMVALGQVDRCLAGGTEACLVGAGFRIWELLRVMTATQNRPFSKDRNGMTLGEGAGVLVLESLEAAQERGAEILCELSGFGTNADAGDLLRPDPKRAAACMRMALKQAGLSPDRIEYLNAHGTGTVANDISEVMALRDVFGEGLDGLEVSSTKPIHGHGLGAAGALEMIVAIGALQRQSAPPTINFTEVDPKIGLEPVPNQAKPMSISAVMSNSLAFGGINASLVAQRYEDG
ncbi:beta-ketoacyl-[acyl-carrier-protein] synthase family protein [Shimia marina]|uniref:3-oxoacyl-[acyl-carrier-protein] synthase 2 n=1 Tax=Shimia marina TaxID=321267 RepID=A0A0P1EPB2_9RHOB|nr:beta-ketoacyl-[acyl-carrier-protein] synthase family protein [Shimia marina]CUH52200.1 3-oxoacyl-[acyl-carrier-protein] synthase 2 [Shimia marina]SFE73533.1 nodulation protein E [Shimia marina]